MLLKDLQTLATKLATGTLFHVEKAGKAYSVDYSALAKAIIEEYADSTVGGSKQSVQAAIGALNSRTTSRTIASGSYNDLTEQGYYYVKQNITDGPTDEVSFARLRVEVYSGASNQFLNPNGTSRIYFRYCSNGTWSTWTKLPTRSEVDANTAAITALNSSATPTLTPNSEIVDRQPWIHRRGNIICFGSYFHLKAECTSNTTLFTMSPQPSVACSIAAVSTTKESYVVYVDKTGIIKPDSDMPSGYYSFVGVVAL